MRGLALAAILYLAFGIQGAMAWGIISVAMAHLLAGDVETDAYVVAGCVTLAIVTLEFACVIRRRRLDPAAWIPPLAFACILYGLVGGVVLFWEHIYPGSGH
jgi:drug/metabolite transporter (DMT)-like permease